MHNYVEAESSAEPELLNSTKLEALAILKCAAATAGCVLSESWLKRSATNELFLVPMLI